MLLTTALMGCKKDNPEPTDNVYTLEVVGEDTWIRLTYNMWVDTFKYELDGEIFEGVSYPLYLTVGDTMFVSVSSPTPPTVIKFYINGNLVEAAQWDHIEELIRHKYFLVEENDIVRIGGEIEFKHNNILVQAEYIHGIDELYSTSKVPVYGGCGGIIRYDTKLAGTYQKGGFLIIAAYKTPWNVEPVIKYDSWNPDLDLNDAWKTNLTIGANYYLNDWTRLQVNYVAAREKTEINNDMIMVQCQIKF